ncbi:acetyl-CoA carboxylase [Lactiplantibacillus pentosus]
MEGTVINKDLKLITSRLISLFKRQSRTRYWLMIANDTYDQTYNVFFNSQRVNERLKSVPLHKLTNYDLVDLERLLKQLRQTIKLTIEFVGFTGERWPTSQKLIQRKQVSLE